MKKLIACLALITSLCSIAQNFEGEIVYTNTIKSKLAQVSNEQWSNMLGTKQSFFIKDQAPAARPLQDLCKTFATS